jgi:hypothetical protein
MLVNQEIPKNKYDPIYYYSGMDFSGMSYLLNDDVLVYNAYKYVSKDVALYLAIASLRPYAKFLADDTRTLPLQFCPVNLGEHMEDDKLIYVDEDENVHFLYEDPDSSLIN